MHTLVHESRTVDRTLNDTLLPIPSQQEISSLYEENDRLSFLYS